MKPLEGITVVSVEQAIAAPFASRQLADLGARVIKVERPGTGDFARHLDSKANGLSSHFVWTNRSKESLTLNLKQVGAVEVLEKLISQADIFIQNLAPGALNRIGLMQEELRKAFPQLIICNISGYGPEGPYRDRKAYDLLIQAEAGLLSITGTEHDVAKAGIPAADIAAGMYAFSGILTALFTRTRTGEGTVLDVSLFESLGEWMGYPAYYTLFDGKAPVRSGAHHASIAPYGPYGLADGETILIAIQNEREWATLCEQVLSAPELASDGRFSINSERVKNRRQLDEIIYPMLHSLTTEEAIAGLESAKIAYGLTRSVQGFLEHSQLKARNRWAEVGSPVGLLPALLPPVTAEGQTPVMNPIPELGEHTVAILEELGLSREQITELAENEAI
ncbi:MAG: CaiB/BaiF CoA-transferase family protein [Trueperaceae bacterium]